MGPSPSYLERCPLRHLEMFSDSRCYFFIRLYQVLIDCDFIEHPKSVSTELELPVRSLFFFDLAFALDGNAVADSL